MTTGASECPIRSGTSLDRSAPDSGSAYGCTRTSPSGCCTSPRRSRRSERSPCNTASDWMDRLPARSGGLGDLDARAAPRRGGRIPGDARASAPPPSAFPGRGGKAIAHGGALGAPCRRRRRSRSRGRGPPREAPPCGPRRADRARDRSAATARAGILDEANRRAPGDVAQDRGQPHRAYLREDRRDQPRDRQPVRRAARAARGIPAPSSPTS
jgi:hypothetical protein